MAVAEYSWPVAALQATETNIAPLEKIGTNNKVIVCAFDQTTEEYRNGQFTVPTDITSGTVTFVAYITGKTISAPDNVALTFGHVALTNSEASDGAAAYTDEDSGDKTVDTTLNDFTKITWTETVSNLGWAADDIILFRISRITAGSNNLADDMYWWTFTIQIPVA